MEINFHFQKSVTLQNRRALKDFLRLIPSREKTSINQLNIIFCSDNYLLRINKEYLNHNYFTDVITFELKDYNKQITGEVYISVDSIKKNANLFNTSVLNELHRVIFHGVLHLCGYKDKTPKDSLLMKSMEDKYLKLYFKDVPRGTKNNRRFT